LDRRHLRGDRHRDITRLLDDGLLVAGGKAEQRRTRYGEPKPRCPRKPAHWLPPILCRKSHPATAHREPYVEPTAVSGRFAWGRLERNEALSLTSSLLAPVSRGTRRRRRRMKSGQRCARICTRAGGHRKDVAGGATGALGASPAITCPLPRRARRPRAGG